MDNDLIKQTFVTPQQAAELEKLGFNEPTLLSVSRVSFTSYGKVKLVSNIASSTQGAYISIDEHDNQIPLPTFEQAFRFLQLEINEDSMFVFKLCDARVTDKLENKLEKINTLIWVLDIKRKEDNND